MPFTRTTHGAAVAPTPADLYRDDLHPRAGAVPGLWGHQIEVLKEFASADARPDIALELPTGTGKTLTGALIAEWTRRKRDARVIYASPTRQLARQAAKAAEAEGIDTALLVGGYRSWSTTAHAAFESAQAVAFTTYTSVFNTNPHFAPVDMILFDDAHAGEQYVGEKYSASISRWDNAAIYHHVLNAVAGGLDGVFLERLRAHDPDPTISKETRLVVPLRQTGMVAALDAALAICPGPLSYQVSMIRSALASCLVYISYGGILIRPYIPPTHQNRLFADARQRVYLSATLGEGGELERAFGRASIHRLGKPATEPRYGRRFFVFPEFVQDSDPKELSKTVVAKAGKALILAPRTDVAVADAEQLKQPSWPVLGVADVGEGMDPFIKLSKGLCALASRYDGIDLPGTSCRLVVLDGLPGQENLQERFLQTRAQAGASLAARVRTRVIQGAGRCTRGPLDTAIVLVLGGELSRYLGRPEVTRAIDPELQAELRFGRENSEAYGRDDVLENVRAFLEQDVDETWRTDAEPVLADYRKEAAVLSPAGTTQLAEAVSHEIAAWAYAAAGAWIESATEAHEVGRILGSGGSATAGYQAFWMYLEAAWRDQAADAAGDRPGRAAAQALVRDAERVTGLGSWVRQMAPFPAMSPPEPTSVDAVAVRVITAMLSAGLNENTLRRRLGAIHAGLQEREPGKFEPALTDLGKLLGAEAYKPGGQARCDSVWKWDLQMWLALEAKSDHEPRGVVAAREIRQANTQLRTLANDAGVDLPPEASATVVISPKPGVHSDGVSGAEPHVHFAAPSTIREIALDADSAWTKLLTNAPGRSDAALRTLVTETLNGLAILPTQIFERLTEEPVRALRE